jgi:putative polymerase
MTRRAQALTMARYDTAAGAGAGSSLVELAAGTLLLAAVLFNPLLAIANAHVKPLSPAFVIGTEVLIVAAAHLLALIAFRARMAPWYLLIFLLVAFAVLRSVAVGSPNVKYLRDVVLIPTFIILGMTFARQHLPRWIVGLHAIVLAVLVLEGVAVDSYSALFDIKNYYIQTRGYTEEGFWNTGSSLFVSATRPDERFFSFVTLHRMSSVFLEPVSLGNYCVIIAAYVLACYRDLRPWQRAFLIGGTMLMLIGCDGRLATITIVMIAAVSLIASRLPRRITFFLPPAVLLIAVAASSFLHLKGGADDFPGRIAHTVDLLRHYGVPELLGISDTYLTQAVDSGLAYLITTQSLLGTVLIWLFIALLAREHTREAVVFKTAIAFYLASSMLVSFSFLSIKTAAILWFILGTMQAGPQMVRVALPRRSRAWQPPPALEAQRLA